MSGNYSGWTPLWIIMLVIAGFAVVLRGIATHKSPAQQFSQRHEDSDELNVNVDAHYTPPDDQAAINAIEHHNKVKTNAIKAKKTKKQKKKKTAKVNAKKNKKKKKKSKKI